MSEKENVKKKKSKEEKLYKMTKKTVKLLQTQEGRMDEIEERLTELEEKDSTVQRYLSNYIIPAVVVGVLTLIEVRMRQASSQREIQ